MIPSRKSIVLGGLLVAALHLASPAWSKVLTVGPDQQFKLPSAAAAAAADGDVIEIQPSSDPSGYFDCAVWTANRITIEGRGAGAVITDKTCQGKALFVTVGNDITIRNLTFTRARVPDHNGAGIRAEGTNLRIERSRFIDNENGILAAAAPKSTMVIADSEFVGNGRCTEACAHGIYIGQSALLRVERCVFRDTREGHAIKSLALRTEVVDTTIVDGKTGTSSYLVDIPMGGALVMRDNVLEKGAKSSNRGAAVSIGEDGVEQPTQEITIADNKFSNDVNKRTVFILNGTATRAKLTGNTFSGQVQPLSGDGSVQ